jgi:hypothetical protein
MGAPSSRVFVPVMEDFGLAEIVVSSVVTVPAFAGARRGQAYLAKLGKKKHCHV